MINPTTGDILGEYREHSEEEVSEFIHLVQHGFQQWSALTIQERSNCMLKLANMFCEREEHCARLITVEMGKPIKQSRADE